MAVTGGLEDRRLYPAADDSGSTDVALWPAPQVCKLLIIPFVCLVEHFWLGKVFTRSVIASVVTVVIGVAVV